MVKPIERMGFAPTYEEHKTNTGWTIIVTPSKLFGGGNAAIELTDAQFARYRQWRTGGKLIQNMLPELTAEQREILLTGLNNKRFYDYIGGNNEDN